MDYSYLVFSLKRDEHNILHKLLLKVQDDTDTFNIITY